MSPLTLRRYRAERLLRQEFEGLRGRVIATVRGRLGASAASLDPSDLDACYAQAWQGLYAAVLDGGEIANPSGWLMLVTYRRAIEELRAHHRVDRVGGNGGHAANGAGTPVAPATGGAEEPDFAAELDDRTRLRHLFEGLRGRLNAREREAAAFCYLQGLSRSEAAARMGISQARMRKLMDGQGAGRPGVAGKVGELAETIRMGGWCEEQGSLMRGLAYGILDPNGERYVLALSHHSECPACRAYVVSLRGLAAVLPPVFLPWGLGAGLLAHASGAAHAGVGAHPGGVPMGAGSGTGSGAQAVNEIGGALSASGAAGVGGAAGGGWLLAGGPLGAKLAVGCVLALGVGAGCVALTEGEAHPRAPRHRHGSAHIAGSGPASNAGGAAPALLSEGRLSASGSLSNRTGSQARAALTPAQQAVREFGPEHGAAPGAADSSFSVARKASAAGSASSGSAPVAVSTARPASPTTHEPPVNDTPAAQPRASAADREFGIG